MFIPSYNYILSGWPFTASISTVMPCSPSSHHLCPLCWPLVVALDTLCSGVQICHRCSNLPWVVVDGDCLCHVLYLVLWVHCLCLCQVVKSPPFVTAVDYAAENVPFQIDFHIDFQVVVDPSAHFWMGAALFQMFRRHFVIAVPPISSVVQFPNWQFLNSSSKSTSGSFEKSILATVNVHPLSEGCR